MQACLHASHHQGRAQAGHSLTPGRREERDPGAAKVWGAQPQLALRVVRRQQPLALAEPQPGQLRAGAERQRAGGQLALLRDVIELRAGEGGRGRVAKGVLKLLC